jgi:hypothetical protein
MVHPHRVTREFCTCELKNTTTTVGDAYSQYMIEPSEQSKEAIREVMEKVEELSEVGAITSGTYVQLSNGIQGIFNKIEDLEMWSMDFGVRGHIMQCLLTNPESAQLGNTQVRLQDWTFVQRLVMVKVDILRMNRGLFEQGPALILSEVFQLECWGEKLCTNALKSWEWHFVKPNGVTTYSPDEPDEQVPLKFKALVIQLIKMQLDLFPVILRKLNQWKVAASNIFPQYLWVMWVCHSPCMPISDPVISAIALEPRMIPFIVGDQYDIDMNGLSKQGPRLRSNTAHFPPGLNFAQTSLINKGINVIRGDHNGHIEKQKFRSSPWAARNIFTETVLSDIIMREDDFY